jgi:hypothetical protein
MQKIDRLVWAAGFCGKSFGVRVGVRANTPEALETLRRLLPIDWRYTTQPIVDLLFSYIEAGPETRPGLKRFNILYFGAARVARTLEPNEVAEAFENTLQLWVAETAPRHAFVHAGVLGWRDRAIVIPGSSQSGKSTLTAALVRAGATYYSDEYAVINNHGHVLPFARRLELRQPDGQPKQKVTAESLGGATGSKPLPLGLVVETSYRAGSRWRPRRGTNGLAALALMSHAVPIQRRPAWTMRLLTRAAGTGSHLKGSRGEAEDVAGRILDEFANW